VSIWVSRRAQLPAGMSLAVVFCTAVLGSLPTPAHAYSSFADYTRDIQEGGAGGHLFTGTPADGYRCDVCHRGRQGAPLDVQGLPVENYQPGQTYEITLRWPETALHTALMAELTDAAGRPTGITTMPPYATWEEGQRCEEGGFPAADICRLDPAGSGCCRDLEPTRDSCSFPGMRSVLWVLDCGSRFARMQWTAPDAAAGDVWFSTAMVTSDVQNNALGDGVTSLRRRIRPPGVDPNLAVGVGDCRALPGQRSAPCVPVALSLLSCLVIAARHRRRARRRSALGARPHHADSDASAADDGLRPRRT